MVHIGESDDSLTPLLQTLSLAVGHVEFPGVCAGALREGMAMKCVRAGTPSSYPAALRRVSESKGKQR